MTSVRLVRMATRQGIQHALPLTTLCRRTRVHLTHTVTPWLQSLTQVSAARPRSCAQGCMRTRAQAIHSSSNVCVGLEMTSPPKAESQQYGLGPKAGSTHSSTQGIATHTQAMALEERICMGLASELDFRLQVVANRHLSVALSRIDGIETLA